MFQFRRFPAYTYLIQCTLHGYCPCGFPHSDIPGSMDICSSPRLFAACHVLLRLLMPRHSPCALLRLTFVLADFAKSRIMLSLHARSLRRSSSCSLNASALAQAYWFSLELCKSSTEVRNYIFYPNLSIKVFTISSLLLCFPLFSFQSATELPAESSYHLSLALRNKKMISTFLVGPSGLEPPTLRFSVVRSSQLSYGPSSFAGYSPLVEIIGIEPMTSCLQSRRSPS